MVLPTPWTEEKVSFFTKVDHFQKDKKSTLITMNQSLMRYIAPVFMVCLMLLTSCGGATKSTPPSPYEQIQQETTKKDSKAVTKESVKGGSLNKFFPDSADGYKRIYSQEKQGFAQAKLKKSGADVALLAINDTKNTPDTKDKFAESKFKIDGYPAIKQGKNSTAVLVGDRYQVKITSKDDTFTASDREVWLEKFDLDGLAKLQ